MICKQVTTRDNRYITQIMCFDKASISRQVNIEGVEMLGSNDGGGYITPVNASIIAPPSNVTTDKTTSDYPRPDTTGTIMTDEPETDNVNCDTTGVCYNVSVHCKDTRIVVQVRTNQPFNGRIYALGRSETCNIQVINSDTFRLDLSMAGQDCNTQNAGGVYTNTVVIQHHSIVMTKTDKIYKVRCTYDMSSKNITFGMLPIRDPDMIPITSAPLAPAPKIRILDAALREVETVRIGDRLTFRIEIPETSKTCTKLLLKIVNTILDYKPTLYKSFY
ncbi:hypothetical protein SK128_022261 [Halocaridina rubra]|uniref:ZP domain-containing protein n=1 Tax=Halocaridina rubra TaxID=373956 RepID=A0AAN8WVG2_HALRR